MSTVWTEALEARLLTELDNASIGQCLRVTNLPRPILEDVARRLSAVAPHHTDIFLVDRVVGPESWRVGVYKVVERRNAEESVVLALFPADLQLAAGDSVDISTFRTIPVDDLQRQVEATLLERVPNSNATWALAVLNYLERRNWTVSGAARLRFLATISTQESDNVSVVGASLYTLGLVPDFALFDESEQFHLRLGQHNIKIVEQLSDQSATAVERVLRLPISDRIFRSRLLSFFRSYAPDDVEAWGEAIASDADWRCLSLDHWPLSVDITSDLRIFIEPLKLPRRKDDGLPFLEQGLQSKVSLSWVTSPLSVDVPDLAYFRVELVNSQRMVMWESTLIKSGSGKTAKKTKTFKSISDLESGVYFFRTIALNPTGDPFPQQPLRDESAGEQSKRINESEDFLLLEAVEAEEVDSTSVSMRSVRGYAEAEKLLQTDAVRTGREARVVAPKAIEWITPFDGRAEAATATLFFDLQHQYSVKVSQRLRRIEKQIFAEPRSGSYFTSVLGHQAEQAVHALLSLPPRLADARSEVLQRLSSVSMQEGAPPVVALADLATIGTAIEQYSECYRAWLDSGDVDALNLDTVRAEVPEYGTCVLVAPTHPLRLLWMLQEQTLGRAWASAHEHGGSTGIPFEIWRDSFSARDIPSTMVLSDGERYVDAGPLLAGWEAYLPLNVEDSRAVASVLRARLGSGVPHASDADIPPKMLADKFELFLRQHPYTPALIMNIVNPGDAALVVDALVDLESRRLSSTLPSIRYVVRLFTESQHREGIGEAFRDLQDPDRAISTAADNLLTPGQSFLFPKLSWSRNELREFVETPEQFPSHITMLLDAFGVTLRVARVDPNDRSSFVHGLVQEAPRRFVGSTQSYVWIRRPAPTECLDLPDAPGRSGLFAGILSALGALQARVLAPNTDSSNALAVAALDLTPADQSLLYSAHAVSTWVLTVDQHLGLDYFDSSQPLERPGYLLDFTPEFLAAGGRHLLLTTRISGEVSKMMEPAAVQLDLDPDGPGAHLLMEALRSLSGRLALRLLSSPTQVQGALGMALSRLFLEAFGLLDESVVIPLDAHPELSEQADPVEPRLRGDLLIVSSNPEMRRLNFLLVESKCHSGTALSPSLRAMISAQLQSSQAALRDAFDPEARDPDRIDRVVQSWHLSGVLRFYLDRAARYRMVAPEALDPLRRFFQDLDAGYTLSFRKLGLVFLLDATESLLNTEDPDLPIWVVGGETMHRVVTDALRRYVEGGEAMPQLAPESRTRTRRDTIDDQSTWDAVRASFGRSAERVRAPSDRTAEPQNSNEALQDHSTSLVATTQDGDSADLGPLNITAAGETQKGYGTRDEEERAAPEYAVLLGDTKASPQYGLLGAVASEPWRRIALDLNGCNTISVFGVQGSGKSYTVGSIIEMAIQRIPNVNVLPRPLAAVVFHYHQTQDYPPEFVSMTEPNDELGDMHALQEWGLRPDGMADLLVLTTDDTLNLRRAEFPHARVEPIAFSSSELTVADWRFLMAATGNDALYLKLVNEVMRKCRANLTLEAIRAGIEDAPLSDNQQVLAAARLDFASRFIDDSRSLRSLLRPGRLIVVDLRDEFIEREQALGLFVTMLNVFSGAGMGSDSFNKLIVLDEAHKYMGGPLIGQVVEVVREMRHKGVSVVIASQDPVNVPSAVIELSSSVVLHRFNAPSWVKHIQKSLVPLAELTPSMLAALSPGEAFMWANRTTDPAFSRRGVKVKMRPRITKHGGATRRAIDE